MLLRSDKYPHANRILHTIMSVNEVSEEHHSMLALFYRRKLYYSTVHLIAARRKELLRDVPIDQLIALAFFSSPSDLKRFGAVPSLRSAILKKYLSQKCDLFHDWQLFCKTVKKAERSEYLVGLCTFFLRLTLG